MEYVNRGGREYRVYGANEVTGNDVEVILRAYDEADAARLANRQGIFVGLCVPVPSAGTFGRAVADDAVAHALLERFPELSFRLSRLNAEDQAYLMDLSSQHRGITRDEASHMAELIRANRDLPRS